MSPGTEEQQPVQSRQQAGTVGIPASPAASATRQDAGLATASQSAISAYDRMLQEKERIILENIARKRSKIHEVERQLADLQLNLHVNVGPRRQALEHLRSLIEQQSYKVDTARTNFKKAKQEMEHWQREMEEAQQHKEQLAMELNTLVQQSAGAQLKRLEELSEELEHLTQDLPANLYSAAAANGRRQSSTAGSEAAAGAAVEVAGASTSPSSATEQRQQQLSETAEPAEGIGAEQNQEEQQRRHQEQQQRQAAADARGRHVQLLLGRKSSSGNSASRVSTTRIPTPPNASRPSAEKGPFQGFD